MSDCALAELHPAEHADDAVLQLIERARTAPSLAAATALLAGTLDLVRTDSPHLDLLAEAFLALATAWRQTSPQQELNALRVGLALKPEHPDLRNGLDSCLAQNGWRAKLSDYTQTIGGEELGRRLLIACFVKSGSTYLSNLLADVTGWPRRSLTYAFMQNEQELYLPALLATARQNSVTQQHVRATAANIHLIQGFGIRPIVQIRDVFDCLLSYKEFLAGGAYVDTFYPRFRELDEVRQMDLVIADRTAWYISFYAGWYRAMRDGKVDGLWVRYEELIADPLGVLRRIGDFHGLAWPDDRITTSLTRLDRSKQRFNRGVSGRGRKAFSREHQQHVERLAGCHPDVDFGPIGL